MIGCIVIGPCEVGIECNAVKMYRRGMFARLRHHFLKRQCIARRRGTSIIPIVTVRADRQYRLLRGHRLEQLCGSKFIPTLTRNRSRITLAVVLIVQHQKDAIVKRRILGQERRRYIRSERHGHDQRWPGALHGVQRASQLDQECAQLRMKFFGDLFKVECHTSQSPFSHQLRHLLRGALTCFGSSDQRNDSFRIKTF